MRPPRIDGGVVVLLSGLHEPHVFPAALAARLEEAEWLVAMLDRANARRELEALATRQRVGGSGQHRVQPAAKADRRRLEPRDILGRVVIPSVERWHNRPAGVR